MIDLEHTINEVASSLSEKEISTTKANADALLSEIKIHGEAKLIMIAWDQQ
jgi:hypothetical protein